MSSYFKKSAAAATTIGLILTVLVSIGTGMASAAETPTEGEMFPPASRLVAEIRCEANRYQGIALADRIGVMMPKSGALTEIATATGKWDVAVSSSPISYRLPQLGEKREPAQEGKGQRALFRFTLKSGESPQSSVGVAFHVANWSEEVFSCMPGAVYCGNRFRSYPVGWYGHYKEADMGPKAEQIVANIPRLEVEKGKPSGIQTMLSRSLTTPGIGLWNPQLKQGVWLLTDQGSSLGDTLIEITENPEHTDAWIRFVSPGVRPTRHYIGRRIPNDKAHDFKTGETLELKLRVFSFPCRDMAEFFAHLFAIRKLELPDRAELPGLTFSRALTLQDEVVGHRWSEQHHIFTDYSRNKGLMNLYYFETGWCGGMMKEYPIYALMGEKFGDKVKQALCSYNQAWAPSGLIYGRMTQEGVWKADCDKPAPYPTPFPKYEKNMTMTERQGDALLYLLKTARLIRHREPQWNLPPQFNENLKRQADLLCRTFEKFGQLGQYLDIRTGDVVIGGSSSAAGVPSALVAAWRYFGDRKYLDTAKALAEQLYRDCAARGNFNGTCGDILQSPDSQGVYYFLPSLMDLYTATGEAEYLVKARHVAWQFASWTASYDYDFKRHFPDCTYARMGNLKTVGASWASAQNLCGVPGLCISSGVSLLELYRLGGDERYLELLRDLTHCALRGVGRPELRSRFPDLKKQLMNDGWLSERFNTTDWCGGPGGFWNESIPWCMTALMLVCQEIPSLYVVADRESAYPFDTLQVGAIHRQKDGLTVELTNPTDFPATYTVLVDKSLDGLKPLPEFFFEQFQRFDFAPRETRVVHLKYP